MKFNTQNLVLVIVFQLMIAGATLYITETNAGAVALPCTIPETASVEMASADFRNACKNYTKFRKVFRNEIKTTHEYCTGIGEKCEYS